MSLNFNIHFSGASRQARHVDSAHNISKGHPWEFSMVERTLLSGSTNVRNSIAKPLGAGKVFVRDQWGLKADVSQINAPGRLAALAALTHQAKLHAFANGLMDLKVHQPGRFCIYARHYHYLWPTSGGNFELNFSHKLEYTDALSKIFIFLSQNGFNQWMPLLKIHEYVHKFFQKDPGHNYIIGIKLWD